MDVDSPGIHLQDHPLHSEDHSDTDHINCTDDLNIGSLQDGIKKCELCGATQTPMWRRGPSGKGSVCNACGVKLGARRKAARKSGEVTNPMSSKNAFGNIDTTVLESDGCFDIPEQYYCKYCGTTWPLNYFKNRQQFGAHCSNCSRKRKSKDVLAPCAIPGSSHLHGDHPTSPRSKSHSYSSSSGLRTHHSTSASSVDMELSEMEPPLKLVKTCEDADSPRTDGSCYDSDSETVGSPFGHTPGNLSRLLGAVESVLTEERELAQLRLQTKVMRKVLEAVNQARNASLEAMEHVVVEQLDQLSMAIHPHRLAMFIANEKSKFLQSQASIGVLTGSAMFPDGAFTTRALPVSTSTAFTPVPSSSTPSSSKHPQHTSDSSTIKTSPPIKLATGDSHSVEPSLPSISSVQGPSSSINIPIVPTPHGLPSSLHSNTQQTAKASMAVSNTPSSATVVIHQTQLLRAPSQSTFSNIGDDVAAIFKDGMLLSTQGTAHIQTLKEYCIQYLQMSKLQISQELNVINELLSALKQRQQLLGQNAYIDHNSLIQMSLDIRGLNQRIMQSSRGFQNLFVTLAGQFTEQIEAAKRRFQEQAGNPVRALDDAIRSKMIPILTHDLDVLRHQLNAQIREIHNKLSFVGSLIVQKADQ